MRRLSAAETFFLQKEGFSPRKIVIILRYCFRGSRHGGGAGWACRRFPSSEAERRASSGRDRFRFPGPCVRRRPSGRPPLRAASSSSRSAPGAHNRSGFRGVRRGCAAAPDGRLPFPAGTWRWRSSQSGERRRAAAAAGTVRRGLRWAGRAGARRGAPVPARGVFPPLCGARAPQPACGGPCCTRSSRRSRPLRAAAARPAR